MSSSSSSSSSSNANVNNNVNANAIANAAAVTEAEARAQVSLLWRDSGRQASTCSPCATPGCTRWSRDKHCTQCMLKSYRGNRDKLTTLSTALNMYVVAESEFITDVLDTEDL